MSRSSTSCVSVKRPKCFFDIFLLRFPIECPGYNISDRTQITFDGRGELKYVTGSGSQRNQSTASAAALACFLSRS